MFNLDPRMLKQAMKKMGIKEQELDAQQVIIKLPDKEIIFNNPKVMKILMSNEESFQITGAFHEQSLKSYSEDDVALVIEKTGCDEQKAIDVLEQTNGDIAEAIILTQQN